MIIDIEYCLFYDNYTVAGYKSWKVPNIEGGVMEKKTPPMGGLDNLKGPVTIPWWLFLGFILEAAFMHIVIFVTVPFLALAGIILAIPLAIWAIKHELPEVTALRSSQPWQVSIRVFPLWIAILMGCMFTLMTLVLVVSFLLL